MQVIYHSDDFGMTASLTNRIADAWEAGWLDGFSILANGDAIDEVHRRLRAATDRDARIAVHLNLFEGPALGPPAETTRIANAEGHLSNSFLGLMRAWRSADAEGRAALLAQVEAEWRRQIDSVRELCAPRKVSALDGHVHQHMLPFLFPVAVSLAREFGIGEIRVVDEPFHLSTRFAESLSPAFPVNFIKWRVLRSCVTSARRHLLRTAIEATDAFVGVLYSGRMSKAAAEAGLQACRKSSADSVEVLFHVGRASADEGKAWQRKGGAPDFALSPMRDYEYEQLRALRS
jgi:predicted glycoside hydrolase/deacetylase ChbG (UPF0249 family)